jgi:hypothetical protein
LKRVDTPSVENWYGKEGLDDIRKALKRVKQENMELGKKDRIVGEVEGSSPLYMAGDKFQEQGKVDPSLLL